MIELKEHVGEGHKIYEIKCVKCGNKILEYEVVYIDRSLVFADTYTVTLREVICPHCKYKYEEIGIT
jgi:DNA-directed RNA polymerase subunit M/transcription elongation factor TFIIS